MLYELYRTLELKVAFTVQLILRTFSGVPLLLRNMYGSIVPPITLFACLFDLVVLDLVLFVIV